MKVRFSHLSLSERRKIERWRQMKLSPDEMARRLSRHRSTIFRGKSDNFVAVASPETRGTWTLDSLFGEDGRSIVAFGASLPRCDMPLRTYGSH